MRIVGALLLAVGTAALYALSTSLQALEARRTSSESALRASLLARLARRPLWVAGTAAGLLAWPMQAGALALASVALVQPALGLGLVVLLALGVRMLGEHVGAREIGGAAAIAAGVGLLAWAAPPGNGRFTRVAEIAVVVAAAAIAAAPFVIRRVRSIGGVAAAAVAGFGWGVVGYATALLDESLARRHWLATAGWLAVVGAASLSSLLAEMTALQSCPATRAVPLTFLVEMALPAALAPFLTSSRPSSEAGFALGLALAAGGAVALGRSRAVAHVVQEGEALTAP
ncbi:MAG TPA: hypothetical protein VFA05_07230 [Gaiellaceae bacterium]|nr:hypothetical protein [Gaiellaceae bacterium]